MATIDFNKQAANVLASTLFGKSLQRIIRRNVDAEYKDKVNKGINTIIANPLRLFAIETIEVTAIAVVPSPNGDCMLRVNDDDKLMFPISSAAMPEPTDEALCKAIEDYEVTGQNPGYFADYDKIISKVNTWNQNEIRRAEAIMEDLSKQISAISKTIEAENAAYKAFKANFRG